MTLTRYFTDYAWLGGDQVTDRVLLEVNGDRIAGVQAGAACPADAVHLPGVTVPGMANSHCHAFHRALRGDAVHVLAPGPERTASPRG